MNYIQDNSENLVIKTEIKIIDDDYESNYEDDYTISPCNVASDDSEEDFKPLKGFEFAMYLIFYFELKFMLLLSHCFRFKRRSDKENIRFRPFEKKFAETRALSILQ